MNGTPIFQKIYRHYGAFCDEIEKLLGEPSNIDIQEGLKLLNRISHLFEAGFVIESSASESRIRAYFGDDRLSPLNRDLAKPFERLVPPSQDLRPGPIDLQPVCGRINNRLGADSAWKLDWESDVVYHFWLKPEESLSLVVVMATRNRPREEIRTNLLKTQAIVQKLFYDGEHP